MTKEQLIEALNKDIADEFASAIQYINHASPITGAKFTAVQKELLVHATKEMPRQDLTGEKDAVE